MTNPSTVPVSKRIMGRTGTRSWRACHSLFLSAMTGSEAWSRHCAARPRMTFLSFAEIVVPLMSITLPARGMRRQPAGPQVMLPSMWRPMCPIPWL